MCSNLEIFDKGYFDKAKKSFEFEIDDSKVFKIASRIFCIAENIKDKNMSRKYLKNVF